MTDNSNNDLPIEQTTEQVVLQIKRLEASIKKAVIGQTQTIREIIVALIASGHVLVEGVPGLGKTLLVRSLTAAVGGKFSRVQFTPDLMPSDITGHMLFDMKSQEFIVRRGPVFCNFLLADEINRAPAKTQSALLEVMQEQQVTIEGNTFALDSPFLVMATQNPIEQEGTYPLPEAQLDRFLLKVKIDYPDIDVEKQLVRQVTDGSIGDKLNVTQVTQALSPKGVMLLQEHAAKLDVDEQVIHYAVQIVQASRTWNGVEIGAGPRGSIALLRAARAQALYNGNAFVTPDDVKEIAPAVLRHRLRLTADLEIEGYSPDDIVRDILANVDVPRI